MQNLVSSAHSNNIEPTLVTFYPNNIRAITNLLTGTTSYETKTQISSVNGPFYRFVTSTEGQISSASITQGNLQPISKTYRLRHIFTGWKPGDGLPSVDVHVTIRTEITATATKQIVSVEIEIPRNVPEIDNQVIRAIADEIMKIHNGWNLGNIVGTIGSMRKHLDATGIRYPNQLQRPFDIRWKDITYENLIATPTAISFKADGVHMLLCISPAGTFFVTGSIEIVPLSFTGTIDDSVILVDGEIVGNRYLAFDLIYSGGSHTGNPYDARHRALTALAPSMCTINTNIVGPILPIGLGPVANTALGNPTITSSSIVFSVKPILIPRTVDDFFAGVADMWELPDVEGIPKDGLILTPVSQPYRNSVYKWKPADRLTVDFFIGPPTLNGGEPRLATFSEGNLLYHDIPIIPGRMVQIGIIGEFHPIYDVNMDMPIGWEFVRQRPDKAIPNSQRVYEAILQIHQDPITLDTLTGNSLHLMRKYHNRVKRSVYDAMKTQQVKTITDIGSGRGGDLDKWASDCFAVKAIEPDVTFVEEFLRRARSMGGQVHEYPPSGGEIHPHTEYNILGPCWEVDLEVVSAENYEPYDRTDALTFFNSITFLGPETLDALIMDAVTTGGIIVILVMDGRRLAGEFLGTSDSYVSDLIEIHRVDCPTGNDQVNGVPSVGADMFGDLGCISIRLGGSSTVNRPQTEGLVDVSVILALMRDNGWMAETDMFLSEEKLLGHEGARYSSAQRLLIFRKGDNVPNSGMEGHILRRIYTPLSVGVTEAINTPWGPLVRVGVMGTDGTTSSNLIMALLYASDYKGYRSMNNISKAVYGAQQARKNIHEITRVPVYVILGNTWDMIIATQSGIMRYPALGARDFNRPQGFVLFVNRGHWEPLAKRTLSGSLEYIW